MEAPASDNEVQPTPQGSSTGGGIPTQSVGEQSTSTPQGPSTEGGMPTQSGGGQSTSGGSGHNTSQSTVFEPIEGDGSGYITSENYCNPEDLAETSGDIYTSDYNPES